MDPSLFLSKRFETSRGFNYRYYVSPPDDGKPTIFFAHGFPSTADVWHKQAVYFKKLGYGCIVPDLLGYGETDKPTDAESYRLKLVVADVMEMLDREKVSKVIAVGHDRGSGLVSRLANYHQDDSRFLGFAFFTAGYQVPNPDFDLEKANAMFRQSLGYEILAYWNFFSEDDADMTIQAHLDSFFSILFTGDFDLWRTVVAKAGGVKEWLEEDRKAQLDTWVTDKEEYKVQTEHVSKNGLAVAFNWYKTFIHKITPKGDADIPKEKYFISKPVFFGAALQDKVCLPALGMGTLQQYCRNTTYVDFETGHWIMNALPDKSNEELRKWIESIV